MKHYFEGEEKVLLELNSSKDGLSSSVAAKLLEENGKNMLEQGKHKSTIERFIDQMKDPMVIILIVAAVISGSFGEMIDAFIIAFVVSLNAILGVVQEGKAEKAIEALQKLSAPQAKVRRDGKVALIKTEDIVIGDIILLEAGDSIPADMRLIETVSMKIEEAALTGESVPAEKDKKVIASSEGEIPLGDRVNMAYMGTNVVYGRGEGVITATGMQTEMGKIANIIANTEEESTPLQKNMEQLSKVLSFIVLGICAFMFAYSFMTDKDHSTKHIVEMLMTAVSLAVAAIPEGLVVVVTVLLSIGVTRMSKRNAIIRRLTAVETLGCTQVICSDKTGTLTQNKMTVADHFGDEKTLATAVSLCSDVSFSEAGVLVGDPTEVGLVQYGINLNLHKNDLTVAHPRCAEAPFDSVRKMMSTLHNFDSKVRQFTKGAPDEILKASNKILMDGKVVDLTEELKKQVLSENKRMADKALRVLGAAYKDYDSVPSDVAPEKIENNLIFIGLCGMIDPVRPEVKDAIVECKEAGIKAVMITGDHRDTAAAIAKELGIITDSSQAITGADLNELSDDEFEKKIDNISVYARVQPEHKVRIVNMWRKKGKITAMTGDGVNDAPAIKSANIGVGMGITGTDVTKNVADMVLADDNFASIVHAVEEGRRIYENIRKAVQFLLASNLSEVITVFVCTVMGKVMLLPIHLLWINVVTDTFPAMALGMEEAEPDSMQKPPRDSKDGIFSDGLAMDVFVQGVIVSILTLASFFIGEETCHTTGMTMAFFTLSMCEVFHSLNMRSRTKSIFKMTTKNMYLTGAMILSTLLTVGVVYIPGLNDLFKLDPLSMNNLLIASGLAFAIIPIVEVLKMFKRK